jgi:hypothetical protein
MFDLFARHEAGSWRLRKSPRLQKRTLILSELRANAKPGVLRARFENSLSKILLQFLFVRAVVWILDHLDLTDWNIADY